MAHNVLIKGNTAYISYYREGVQIYDISDPLNPKRLSFFNSGNYIEFDGKIEPFQGMWGVYPFLPLPGIY